METSQVLAAETVSFTIPKLKESTTYTIGMSAMVGGREGGPTLLTAKTCGRGLLDGDKSISTLVLGAISS